MSLALLLHSSRDDFRMKYYYLILKRERERDGEAAIYNELLSPIDLLNRISLQHSRLKLRSLEFVEIFVQIEILEYVNQKGDKKRRKKISSSNRQII